MDSKILSHQNPFTWPLAFRVGLNVRENTMLGANTEARYCYDGALFLPPAVQQTASASSLEGLEAYNCSRPVEAGSHLTRKLETTRQLGYCASPAFDSVAFLQLLLDQLWQNLTRFNVRALLDGPEAFVKSSPSCRRVCKRRGTAASIRPNLRRRPAPKRACVFD